MNRFKMFITLVFSAIFMNGCFHESGILGYKPKPWGIGGPAENASPEYKQGWHDGCETGMAEFGTSAYKSFYKFKQNIALIDNPTYYQVWKQAEQYCKHYSGKWNLRSETEMPTKIFGPNASPLCVFCEPTDKFHGY